MRIADTSTPVVVLRCGLGALAIARYLGARGIDVHGVDADPPAPAFRSRFLRRRLLAAPDPLDPGPFLEKLLAFGRSLGRRPLLVATRDDTALFVAQHAGRLEACFRFPRNEARLVASLVSKRGMYGLARDHGVPTPETLFPRSLAEVEAALGTVTFPLVLKAIDGTRLQRRTGKKMMIVHSARELVDGYRALEDPGAPNLMLQEHIPGGDDEVYIFNGYFDGGSHCLAGFTGHKIRQFPIHLGCASLGECASNPEVAALTIDFMRRLGYRGVLDIGYRFDPRDGRYKVLDINPRVGQAFRIFVARNGLDVVSCMYLHLTGQPVPAAEPREGRRWLIEDMDLISSLRYRREGGLPLRAWLASFRGVEECAWFHARDLRPFLAMARRTLLRGWRGRRRDSATPAGAPAGPRPAATAPE